MMARVKGTTQLYMPSRRLFTNGMSHHAFTPQPQSITALCPVVISKFPFFLVYQSIRCEYFVI